MRSARPAMQELVAVIETVNSLQDAGCCDTQTETTNIAVV
jgi:hypothetical protein